VEASAVLTAPVLALAPQDWDTILDELTAYHAIFRPLFARQEQRAWSRQYLHGLLLELPRKSIEPMVLALRGADRNAVRAMQQFLSEGAWDDRAILQRLWSELARDLGDAEDGVLVLDGSDCPKQGQDSVGVKRQYCGQLGKTANCQAGMFLAYASARGYALLDRRLYVPEAWFTDAYAERRLACGVPADASFTTKPRLGLEMIQAVLKADSLPFQWVAGDEAFGDNPALLDAISAVPGGACNPPCDGRCPLGAGGAALLAGGEPPCLPVPSQAPHGAEQGSALKSRCNNRPPSV
jgi:SRSO17 transposase